MNHQISSTKPTTQGRPVPLETSKSLPQVWAYLTGTFAAQLANNALQVTLPLLVLQMSKSLSAVGFITALTTAVDTAGTLLGGRLSDRFHPRTLLVTSTALRSFSLAFIPILWGAGSLTLEGAVGLFLLDALARGMADTACNTMPLVLAEKNKRALDWLNSRYQTAFELGVVVGPFLVGFLLLGFGAVAANWLIPSAFAVATAIYLWIPRIARPSAQERGAGGQPTFRSAAKVITLNPGLRLAFIGLVLLTLYPLRAVLPALFADNILNAPGQTAWLVGLFGLGAASGSMLYGRISGAITSDAWLRWSAAGVLLLAMAWLPGAFLPMAVSIFVFASSNAMARLAMVSTLQSQIPHGAEGTIMGLTRFSVNLTSMMIRLMVGLAFAVTALPLHGFALIGAGLYVFAVLAFLISHRLAAAVTPLTQDTNPGPRPSAAHGMPGRLIVFEGLDGSGKSTQIEMVKSYLQAQGLKVVTTTWNASAYVTETIKKLRKAQGMAPNTFSVEYVIRLTNRLHKAIVEDRFQKVMLPALQEGAVVLSDRYFYTALARDRVRGLDPQWLRALYSSAIRPDLVLYFKVPVEKAISRVISRTQDSLKLSEELDEEHAQPPTNGSGIKYFEAGLDLRLSEDPMENFHMFQTWVAAEYDAMVREFGFYVIDAQRNREAVHAEITTRVIENLGTLSSFARNGKGPHASELFDKDPAHDSPNIRENYLHGERGIHFYFRTMLLPMQERFAELVDLSETPKVLLHGSPHVDNYSKSAQGAAMIDFDRSRFGPYTWDIVRFLTSLSLRQRDPGVEFLDRSVLQQFMTGYLKGLRQPEAGYAEMPMLKEIKPDETEATTTAYLKANKPWAQAMRKNALPPGHPEVTILLCEYLSNRNELNLLDEYYVEEAGRGFGSMGQHRFLIVLAPKDPRSGKDRIFLEIKRVYEDRDTGWYTNPFDHQGKRMMAAAELYAPGWEQRQGFVTYQGLQYWGHQIPTQNVKLKEMLDTDEQEELAYAVGTQLGRAHRLSLQDAAPRILEEHLKEHFQEIVRAGETIKDEMTSAYARYLKRMKDQGMDLEAIRTAAVEVFFKDQTQQPLQALAA